MNSHRGSTKVNSHHQMLVSSPKCSLNCQGLSIHLPPLSQQRDHCAYSYLSPPMSGSFSEHKLERQTSKISSSHSLHAASPTTRPSFSTDNRNSVDPKVASYASAKRKDILGVASTPTEFEGSRPAPQSINEIPKFLGDSNDELSSNTQDSPGAQQLVPGPPGIARRAKAHVPSACVNCKKKHLACETKRPCNRCISTGKEASCVDVQHKKRGRPRLREEDSLRGLGFSADFPAEGLYHGPNGLPNHPNRHRSKTYRELRSQPEAYVDQRPRTSDTNFSSPYLGVNHGYQISSPTVSLFSDSIPAALLTTDLVLVQHNRALSEALSLSFTARGQGLLDFVVPAGRERIRRLQSSLRAELRDLEIVTGAISSHAPIPSIEQIDVLQATTGFRTRSEYWTFRLPHEQSRGFPISVSLARDGPCFVILTLVPSMVQSPSCQYNFANTPLLASPPLQLMSSPPKTSHGFPTDEYHRSTLSDNGSPYLISSACSNLDEQVLQAHPAYSLAQYKQLSPPQSAHSVSYTVSRADSSSSGNGSDMPRSSPGHQEQILSRDSLRHLQLPPIRTTPTSDPNSNGRDVALRRRIQSGTPSPGRSSPHGSKRKKRRKVEIGDILH